MATQAKSAKGVKLQRGDAATPEVFTAVAEVKDIGGPDESADQIEATSLDSTAKEYIAGLEDGGEVQCEANAVTGDTAQTAIYTDFKSGAKSNYQISLPEGGGWQFAAIVSKHGRKFGTNAIRTLSFSLKISGAVTPIGEG